MATLKKYWKLHELREKLYRDNDLEDEGWINATELNGYINEAIEQIEGIVHTLYEDYFLRKSAPLPLVIGTDSYALPEDIYAHKIRKIFFIDGSEAPTEVTRAKEKTKFGRYTDDRFNSVGDGREFNYFLLNDVPGEPKITLTPVPNRSGNLVFWYLRQANKLVLDEDILDIPEGANFVMQYAKVRTYEKEGHPLLQKGIEDLIAQKDLFETVMRNMVVDDQNQIDMDLSFYQEMS